MRTASRQRATEGDDASPSPSISTAPVAPTSPPGIPFYDHMLDQLGRHSGFDLTVHAEGDLHIDTHHTVEDVAITLGETFAEALGDKAGSSALRQRSVPARRGARRGRPRPVGPAVRRLGRADAREPAARQPAVRSATRRARRVVVRHQRGDHLARQRCARAATRITSSRRRSRASPAVFATPCASTPPPKVSRRRRARCDCAAAASRSSTTGSATCTRRRRRWPAWAPTPDSPTTPV